MDAHRGYFSFTGDFGRSGIDNLRYGTPSQYIGSVGDVHRGFRQWMPEIYAGDNWKVIRSLRLNYGLRYEPAGRPIEVNGMNTIPYGLRLQQRRAAVRIRLSLASIVGEFCEARMACTSAISFRSPIRKFAFRLPAV